MPPHRGFIVLYAAVVLTTSAGGHAAPGMDERVVDPFGGIERELVQVPRDAVPFQLAPNRASASLFDRVAFGANQTEQQVRARLDTLLTVKLYSIHQSCRLSEDQLKKLQLAGRGDISRYFDTIDQLRVKFLESQNNPDLLKLIPQEVQPLQTRLNSEFFNDTSLLEKVCNRVLSPDQKSAWERSELERRRFRYKARIALIVAMLEETMPMRDDQRQRLEQMIFDETKLPTKFSASDHYMVALKMATIPEEKLRTILDEDQWQAMQAGIRSARMMERTLREQGYLP